MNQTRKQLALANALDVIGALGDKAHAPLIGELRDFHAEVTAVGPPTPNGWNNGATHTAHRGSQCPCCKGRGTEPDGDDTLHESVTMLRVPRKCTACGARWHDLYRMCGYEAQAGGAEIAATEAITGVSA